MKIKRNDLIYLALSVLLVLILTGCTILGCDGILTTYSSIKGVLSVPITGEQIYETDDSFGSDSGTSQNISYGDTAYGLIDSSGDIDFFTFTGTANDSIIIDIDAESVGSALDSYIELYDDPPTTSIAENDDYPLDAAHDPDNYIFTYDSHIETILTSNGTYYIKVQSYGGQSSGSYQLRLFKISSKGGSTASASKEVDFVPDEIIVKYKKGFDTESIKSMAEAGEYIVVNSDKNIHNGALELLKVNISSKSLMTEASIKASTLAEIERLNNLPYVEYAEPNYIMKPLFVPDDLYYSFQWHYPIIKLDMVWDEGLVADTSSVIVAVLDSGIARSNGTKSGSNHPDLWDNFVDEYDFITNTNMSLDGDGMDPDASDPGDDPQGQLSSFHGTHVIGTIAAITNNDRGVAGVASREIQLNSVKIMPLRALGAGGGTTYDISQAVLYAAGLPNSSTEVPFQAADILNMSLGSPADSTTLRNAITDAFNAGVLIIAAAGNEGTSTAYYPAAYENVVSVSSVGPGGELAPYSTFGGTVDISAPGGDLSNDITFDGKVDGVLSTLFDQNGSSYTPNYLFKEGTSMAAPHVAGVAALLKAANNGLDKNGLRNTLLNTVIDIGPAGYDIYYGHGLVNAYAAVKSTLGQAENPVLYPFPRALKFEGEAPGAKSFTLKNIGGSGNISVTSITEVNDPEGLISNIAPSTDITVDEIGQDIDVFLNTTGLKDGSTYYAKLVVSYSSGKNEYVYVLYNSKGFPEVFEIEDIGNVFVGAYLPNSEEPIAMTVTTFSDYYSYKIQGLGPGNYIIKAGTDRDNDSVITDYGEALGSYPVYEYPVKIEVKDGREITGIDFKMIENASAGQD